MADTFQRQQGLVTSPALRSGNSFPDIPKVLGSAQFHEFRQFIDGFPKLVEQYQGSSPEDCYKQLISPLADCLIGTYQRIHPEKNTHENTDYKLLFQLTNYAVRAIKSALPASEKSSVLETLRQYHLEEALYGLSRLRQCETTLDQLVQPLLKEIPHWKKNGDVLVLDVDSTALNSEPGHNLPPLRLFEFLLRFTKMADRDGFEQPLMTDFLKEHENADKARPQILALYQACKDAEVPVKVLTSRRPRELDAKNMGFSPQTEADLQAAGFNVERGDIHFLFPGMNKAQQLAWLVKEGILPRDPRQIQWLDDSIQIEKDLKYFSSFGADNLAFTPEVQAVFAEHRPSSYRIPTKPWLGMTGLF